MIGFSVINAFVNLKIILSVLKLGLDKVFELLKLFRPAVIHKDGARHDKDAATSFVNEFSKYIPASPWMSAQF